MKVRILSSASRDLLSGKSFYARQANGLGDYFFDSLSSELESLRIDAGIHCRIRNYHCRLAKRFPYAVYCRVESGAIRVYRILHCPQNPAKTKHALPEEKNGDER